MFSFLYVLIIVKVIAHSMLYLKHLNKHNNQQFNVKENLKKDSRPC